MKQRIECIDNAKGILIVLVVWGHILPDKSILKQFIYIFHMPAFFIISGILFNYSKILDISIWKAVAKKLYTLIIPYVFFELIAITLDIAVHGAYQNIQGYMYDMLTLNVLNYADWFRPVLFLGEICFVFVCKNVLSIYARILSGVSAVLISVFLSLYWERVGIISKVALCYAFLVLGYYGYRLFEKNNVVIIVISLFIIVIATGITSQLGIENMRTSKCFTFMLAAIAGTYCIIQLAKLKCFDIFNFFGKNSLIVMGTHVPILTFLLGSGIPLLKISLDLGAGIFLLGLIMILEIPIIFLLENYLPYVVGKNKI